MESARKFKIIVNSKECGTCSGPTPSAVAKKVVKKLCGTSSKAVRFSLKECKRGCERVCGPYQGRMEKLDKPCKRDGKMITHRVVCGKVRKMRGGRNLRIEDFEKREGDGDFRIDTSIGFEPYIFFGSTEYLGHNSYNFAIFCEKWFGGQVVIHTVGNLKLKVNDHKFQDKYFISLLNKLKTYLGKLNGFRRIKAYLNRIIKEEREGEGEGELRVEDFKLSGPLLNYFEIKYIGSGSIPYLFLYSNEVISVTKNIMHYNEYRRNFKFAISNNCDIFMYENGKIKLLNKNYVELEKNELFKLLNIHSLFFNAENRRKHIANGTILDMIKKVYPDLKDIISCLENLHLMYEEGNKRN
jgi:hypothetical protein